MIGQMGSWGCPGGRCGCHPYGAWGDGETSPVATGSDATALATSGQSKASAVLNLLSTYAPAIYAITSQFSDPVKQMEVLQAQLRSQIANGAPAASIALTQAKLAAARHAVEVANQSAVSTQEWSTLGKIGAVAAIGLGVSLIIWVLSRAFR